jgi:hypothetical protein
MTGLQSPSSQSQASTYGAWASALLLPAAAPTVVYKPAAGDDSHGHGEPGREVAAGPLEHDHGHRVVDRWLLEHVVVDPALVAAVVLYLTGLEVHLASRAVRFGDRERLRATRSGQHHHAEQHTTPGSQLCRALHSRSDPAAV